MSIHVLLSGLQSHDEPVNWKPEIGEVRHSHWPSHVHTPLSEPVYIINTYIIVIMYTYTYDGDTVYIQSPLLVIMYTHTYNGDTVYMR